MDTRTSLCKKCYVNRADHASMCTDCIIWHSIIQGKTINDANLRDSIFFPNIRFTLVVKITKTTHNGMCFEYHSSTTTKKQTNDITYDSFLPRFFTRDDINENNTLKTNTANFERLLSILNIKKNINCPDCGTDFDIITAAVYKFVSVRDMM